MTASQPSPPYVPGRRAGLLVPLFSLRSTTGWGIGEIRDLPHLMGGCARPASACCNCSR